MVTHCNLVPLNYEPAYICDPYLLTGINGA